MLLEITRVLGSKLSTVALLVGGGGELGVGIGFFFFRAKEELVGEPLLDEGSFSIGL